MIDADRLRCGHFAAGDLDLSRGSAASEGLGAAAVTDHIRKSLLGDKSVYAPDRAFDTLHVRLDLRVDFKRKSVAGTCTTTIKVLADQTRTLTFNAAEMRILSAAWQGRIIPHRHKHGRLTLTLPRNLHAREETEVVVKYRITRPKTGFHFIGPGPEDRDCPQQLWSQGQPEDAHYWFPCHDSPHEKATSEVLATVPKGFLAVSNGVLFSQEAVAGSTTFHWRMHHPHALYLVSLAVGRFAEVKTRWEDVDILYYCEKGREADAKRGFSATVPAMDFFSDYFGVRYPYERYAQVAAVQFPGGMENTTCTTMTDACLLTLAAGLDNDLDLLVSHELAHHWFGNLVTCRDWSHAWLNEGFATYSEMLFIEHYKGRDEADYELETNRRSYFSEDSDRYRRPLVCDTYKYPWVLFDRHLYEKGGWVLHMLRYVLGEEAWRKCLREYLGRFRGKSVETNDLIVSIEESTGRNLRYFFDQWVYKSGYPRYQVRYRWDKKSRIAELTVRQTQGKPLFKMPVLLRFTATGWSRDFTKIVEKKEQVLRLKLPGEPLTVEFDPEHHILKKVDFSKPYAMWRRQLESAQSAMSRSAAAQALARWGDEDAVRVLTAAVRRDAFWGAASDAASALGDIRSDSAFRALKSLLKVPHPKTRRAVVSALGNFPGGATSRLLTPILTRDRSLRVRGAAAHGLGRMRDASVISRLQRALASSSYRDIVAAGALQGLAATKDVKVLPLLRKASRPPTSFPLRAHALRALGQFAERSPQVVDWICEALETKDERILLSAIAALGAAGDRRAEKPLENTRERHSDTRVKSYVGEALARIRGEAGT